MGTTSKASLKHWSLILATILYCAPIASSQPLYKNPIASVDERVKDLINRMTLEEKVGQMIQIERSIANTSTIQSYYIGKYMYLSMEICIMCIVYIPPSILLYHRHVSCRNVCAIFVSTHIMCNIYTHTQYILYIDITFAFLFSCFFI